MRLRDSNAQGGGGYSVALDPRQPLPPEHHRCGMCVGEPRLADGCCPKHVTRSDVEPDGNHWKPRRRQSDSVPALSRLARPALKRGRGGERSSPDAWFKRDAGGHRRWEWQASAVGVVPRGAEVTKRTGGERKSELLQSFLRQIEQRALAGEQGPPLTIAAPLELHALQKRGRETVDTNHVYIADGTEIGFEAARGLGHGLRQDRGPRPFRHSRRVRQHVRHLASLRIQDPQIGQTALGPPFTLTDWVDARHWLRAGQERHINRQSLRAHTRRHDRPLHAERARRLLGGQRRRRYEEPENVGLAARGGAEDVNATHAASLGFARTYF